MDCREAEVLIQLDLDRALLGDDDRFAAAEVPSKTAFLNEHIDGCPRCAPLRRGLVAIDAALRSAPVEKAPVWLADAVMSEVAETSTARRLAIPLALSASVAVGVTGSVFVLVRSEAGQTTGRALGTFWNALSSLLVSAQDAVTGSAGFQAAQGSPVGDVVLGVLWGLVAVSVAFIAVSGLRTARELTHELQPISLH